MSKGISEEVKGTTEGLTTMGRRSFLKTAGAGAAAAGTTLAAGCRKPVQHILPYGKRPEDVIPGKPVYYATGLSVGDRVESVLVESHDGRPTKIEGNPQHPSSDGATSPWAQSSVLDLYDPDRSREARSGEETKTLEEARVYLAELANAAKANGGKGFAICTDWVPSPSYARALRALKAAHPNAKIYHHDPLFAFEAQRGREMVGAEDTGISYALENAKVIVTLDADILGNEGDVVSNGKGYAAGRNVDEDAEGMNRLYSVEPRFTVTGTNADHRLQIRGEQVGEFLAELAQALVKKNAALPAGVSLPVSKLDAGSNQGRAEKWLEALSADLLANKGKSVVIVGDRQPAHVHALGHLVNQMLGAFGSTVKMVNRVGLPVDGDITSLAGALDSGEAETVVLIGSNPVFTAPVGLGFGEKLSKAKTVVHIGQKDDNTGKAATWHIPQAHYLESWGDLQGSNGHSLIQQPLIAPLFGGISALEVALLLTGDQTAAHDYVKATWMTVTGGASTEQLDVKRAAAKSAEDAASAAQDVLQQVTASGTGGDLEDPQSPLAVATEKATLAQKALVEAQAAVTAAEQEAQAKAKEAAAARQAAWARWVQQGIIEDAPEAATKALTWDTLAGAWGERSIGGGSGYELNFTYDYHVGDGRFANNVWLQEMPEPITKIAWDNAASIGKATARTLNVASGDMLRIEADGNSLDIAAFVTHGVAENAIVLPLGYGQENGGQFAADAGFNTFGLKKNAGMIQGGATVTKIEGTYTLANTQDEKGDYSQEIRDRIDSLVRKNTIGGYTEEQQKTEAGSAVPSVKKYEVMPKEKLKSLFPVPDNHMTGTQWNKEGQQWGMTIDLTSCTGCNACAVACQAENNVAVVGKKEVANGREMHWLRMDRYFDGDENNPGSDVQPLGCAHCENAPCETVCPVAATVHGPEGTNDIAYNRCIGTRYCANNCPYKVRRFNYYNFSKRMDDSFGPLIAMQRNPDVTVRFRGVIEKCSFCVQRISEAHIVAKTTGERTGKVVDGGVQTACQQACPTGAIVFGDVADPKTAVSKRKASPRNYALLAELNIHPRTTYLARIQNPNPALVEG